MTGVTSAKRKDGSVYYRASITIKSKHVSLGSYSTEKDASKAYREATDIVRNNKYILSDYTNSFTLPFQKFVSLVNYAHSGIYFKTPIYLETGYFYYYFTPEHYLIFDREDLFFYASRKIQVRGGYYFICDYGSQYNILSRFGIKNYAKKGTDYVFVNQNEYDFRYENIRVINSYMGVSQVEYQQKTCYEAVIHIRGNYIIGRYENAETAAVAYNKAVDILAEKGVRKQFVKNYINEYSSEQYKQAYRQVRIAPHILNYMPD